MLGFKYLQHLYLDRQMMTKAKQNPRYKDFILKAENRVFGACYSRNHEEVYIILPLPPALEAKLACRLVEQAVNKRNISLGLSIKVTLNEEKRVITCRVPRHNTKPSYFY